MLKVVSVDALKNALHAEDIGTPDERWKPTSEIIAIIDALAVEIDSLNTRRKEV